jgi:hypothetical protein
VAASTLAWGGSLEAGIDAYNGGDYALAIHHLQPLAEHGNAQAQTYLGAMYANGLGMTQNELTAVSWYLHAAMQGYADAQLKLSDMYSLGKGVAENDTIAAYWKWRAANVTLDTARNNLNAGMPKDATDTSNKSGTRPAVASKCIPPPYVHDAAHFGEVGTTGIVFLVDANGKALQASVAETSDWPRLDRLARDAYGSCTFTPAMSNGKAVPGVTRMFYEWNPK